MTLSPGPGRCVVPLVSLAAALAVLCGTAACSSGRPSTAPGRRDPTVVAVGDISGKRVGEQQATSDLALGLAPTQVLALGDQQYPDGSLAGYQAAYDPTWGRLKAITRPTPGNHDYHQGGAAGYFAYFGAAARPQGHSYYSFDLGGWHLVSLDSNIGTGPGSAQQAWLRADLAATSKRCVLAFWHAPRFSSGTEHGDSLNVSGLWDLLFARHADVVLNGHEHNYERFGPQNPQAAGDAQGIREFVVGTGGNELYPFGAARPNSEKRLNSTYGVLRLVLHPGSYEWQYVGVGGAVLDKGGPQACH